MIQFENMRGNASPVREIKLNDGQVTIVDADDFDFANMYRWRFKPSGAGIGYARTAIRVGNKFQHYVLHRLIIRARPHEIVDHINRDGLDNRKANLRFCSLSENMVNRKNINKTGFRGVSARGNRFAASIAFEGKYWYGRRRSTAVEAAQDYDAMAREIHGDFAFLNFPDSDLSGSTRGDALPLLQTSEGAF